MSRRTVALSVAVAAVWATPVVGVPGPSAPPAAHTRDVLVTDWSAPARAPERDRASASSEDGGMADVHSDEDATHAHTSDTTATWSVSAPMPAGDSVLVGADWGGDPDVDVQVRTRDSDGWSEWVALHTGAEHVPDDGSKEAARVAASTASDPVFVGRVDAFQFRVSGGRPPIEARFVDIAGDMTWTPDAAPPAGAAAAATTLPRIRPRASWGADESIRTKKVSYADDVRFSVVHHEGGVPRWTKEAIENGCREADDAIRAIYEYHVRSRGYWDIGYNFVVDPCGGIWEGRAGGIDRAVIGAHAGGWNAGSFGVLALGTFSDLRNSSGAVVRSADPITDDMIEGIEDLVAWKLDHHHADPRGTVSEISGGGSSRYPSGTRVNVPVLSAHQITNSTSCPGHDLMDRLFNGRERAGTPKQSYTNGVLTNGLPKAFDRQPARWTASDVDDRPVWDVQFTEALDWSLRITDEEGALVRATGGRDETRAQRTWDLRDSRGRMVDAGTYTATLTGRGPSGVITPVVTELVIAPTVKRRQGENREATSVALSTWAFETADTAILASAQAYPDALVSGPLAGSLDAPVLLTGRDDLPEEVESEIRRLGADQVYVIGGEVAVGDAVEDELARDLPGVAVERLGGADRFATAALVAEQVLGDATTDEVLLSLGRHADPSRAFPDALSAGAFGAAQQLPVLLTSGDELPEPTADALEAMAPDTVRVFGGTVAISQDVADEVRAASGGLVRRFAGETRYDTSRLAAEELLARRGITGPTAGDGLVDLIFASGTNWPDALGAGAAAAKTGTLFLLTHPRDLDDAAATRSFLERWNGRIGRASVAGGPVAISGTVLNQLSPYVSDDEREPTEPIAWPTDPN